MDFDNLSDDELIALSNKRGFKPAAKPKKTKSFDEMSDDELIQLSDSQGYAPPSAPPPSKKIHQAQISMEVAPAPQPSWQDGLNTLLAPARQSVQEQKDLKQSGMPIRFGTTTPWNPFDTSHPLVDTSTDELAVKGAAWAKGLGNVIDIPAALGDYAGRRAMDAVYDYSTNNDPLLKFLKPYVIDKAMGVGTGHQGYKQMVAELDRRMQPIASKAPSFAAGYQTGVEFAAPLPNISVAKGLAAIPKAGKWAEAVGKGSAGAMIGDVAATGAAISGLQDAAHQYREEEHIDPTRVAAATALGAGGGALIGAGGAALTGIARKFSRGGLSAEGGGHAIPPPSSVTEETGEVLPHTKAVLDQLMADVHPADAEWLAPLAPQAPAHELPPSFRRAIDEAKAQPLTPEREALQDAIAEGVPKGEQRNKRVRELLLQKGPLAVAGLMAAELAMADDADAAELEGGKKKADYKGWIALMAAVAAGGTIAAGHTAGKRYGNPAAMIRRIGTLWADSLDLVGHLDELVRSQPVIATSTLSDRILGHVAQSHQATWGVKFNNPEQAAEALAAFRSNSITAADALAGRAGTPFEHLNQSQRYAIVTQQLIRRRLSRDVAEYHDAIAAAVSAGHIEAGAGTAGAVTEEAVQALQALNHALNGGAKPASFLDDISSMLLGNAMDGFFFWNPQHHLTNLTDQFIGGGSYVGPGNIFKANQLLLPGRAGDDELRSLLRDSNLTGGLRAERAELSATTASGGIASAIRRVAGTPVVQAAKRIAGADLPSDRINADRVALGSLLEFHGLNASRIGHDDAVRFAKEVLRPNSTLDPTLAMEARVHMAERLMRTLGADPMRVNQNIFQRSKMGNLFVFVSQPARISRLMGQYLQRGQWGSAGVLLGTTLLVGGKAVIPSDLGFLWEQFDPNSFFAARKLADEADIYQRVTGQSNSAKLGMAAVPMTMAVPPMAYEQLGQLSENIRKLSKFSDIEDPEAQKAILSTAAMFMKLTMSGVFAAVGREGYRYATEHVDSENDTKSIYPTEQLPLGLAGRAGVPRKIEVIPSDYDIDLLDRMKARVLPGDIKAFDNVKQAAIQEKGIENAAERAWLPVPDYLPESINVPLLGEYSPKYKSEPQGVSSIWDALRGKTRNAK